jgi:hypothetical protein
MHKALMQIFIPTFPTGWPDPALEQATVVLHEPPRV